MATEEFSELLVYNIPLTEIFADEEWNCRGYIDPLDVWELAKDIASKGLIQPIVLQPWDKVKGKKFRIVCGYSRFKATVMNSKKDQNIKAIKAIIKNGLSELDASVLNLSENLMRRNLNVMQEAKTIKKFYTAGWTPGEVQRKTGLTYHWIQTRMMALDLPEELQKEAAAGMITQTQIRELSKMQGDPDQQFEYYRALKDAKLSGKKEKPPEKVMRINASKVRNEREIFELQDILIETFGIGDPIAIVGIKLLGWATGKLSDKEIYDYLEKRAKESGKFFPRPQLLAS